MQLDAYCLKQIHPLYCQQFKVLFSENQIRFSVKNRIKQKHIFSSKDQECVQKESTRSVLGLKLKMRLQ